MPYSDADREYQKQYRATHKDIIKARKHAYYKSHRGKNAARYGSQEHKEKLIATMHTEQYKKNHRIAVMKTLELPGYKERRGTALKNALARPENIKARRFITTNLWARPEYRKKQSGENSVFWKGGISTWPYCPAFNNVLKENIRKAFGRRCFLSGAREHNQKLSIHHCDYLKSQGCKGQRWSLLPLEKGWHSKTNGNRWYWFALLRDYWVYKYLSFHGMDIFEGPDRTTWLWEMYNNGSN